MEIEEEGIAQVDPDKRIAKWSMTLEETREIAEGLIMTIEKSETPT